MKKIMMSIIAMGILSIFLISLVSAETSFFIPKGTEYSLRVSCDNEGADCSASAVCNLSVSYPNSSLLFAQEEMDNLNNGYFEKNLSADQTNPSGEYVGRTNCKDGSVEETITFTYEVNPPGIRPSESRTQSVTRSIYFMFGIGILLFIGFFFTKQSVPMKWTLFAVGVMFFLIAINLLLVGIQDEVVNTRLETFFDGFTAVSWYFFYFVAFLLILMWGFTFFQTWFLKKNTENLRRFGGEMNG